MGNQHAEIVAVVTITPEKVQGGGAPVFIAKDHQELQVISLTLEKIMDAAAHEIDVDTLIIVAR
ncbi:capping complex subunit for YIEGIA [Sporosarcina sp. FA9]|uniref:capping complex subunit for YIEGIA n=1 Tax=Sporosarcina sp. FA9 TaxID=3413030 RepID=UPI003F65EA48